MTKPANRAIKGEWACDGCGSTVNVKQQKDMRLYYRCNGEVEGMGCGHSATFGPQPSRDMLKKFQAQITIGSKEAKPDATSEKTEAVTIGNPGDDPAGQPAGDPEPKPARKRRRGI